MSERTGLDNDNDRDDDDGETATAREGWIACGIGDKFLRRDFLGTFRTRDNVNALNRVPGVHIPSSSSLHRRISYQSLLHYARF
jgi:hypothetical protein